MLAPMGKCLPAAGRGAATVLLAWAALAGAPLAAQPADADAPPRAEASCPHVSRARTEAYRHLREPRPLRGPPTFPALRRELLLLARQDQALRDPGRPASPEEMHATSARHLARLRAIVRDGLPLARSVGRDGLAALWLLIQHADADPALQARLLPQVLAGTRRGDFSPASYALLYDRVQLAHHRPQRYATQVQAAGDAFVPTPPLEDPRHLDARRRSMGLIPFADQACLLAAARAAAATAPTAGAAPDAVAVE